MGSVRVYYRKKYIFELTIFVPTKFWIFNWILVIPKIGETFPLPLQSFIATPFTHLNLFQANLTWHQERFLSCCVCLSGTNQFLCNHSAQNFISRCQKYWCDIRLKRSIWSGFIWGTEFLINSIVQSTTRYSFEKYFCAWWSWA